MNEPASEVQHRPRQPKGKQYYYYRPQIRPTIPSTYLTFAFAISTTPPLAQ
jgi:hypothetical protein